MTAKKTFWRSSALLLATANLIGFPTYRTFAQEAQAQAYHSDADDLLTLEKISVFPFTDNLEGIYARPLESHFISLVDKMHRWNYLPANGSGPLLAPEELESDPEKVKQVTQGMGVDGVFVARVSKGPNGVTIHLSLFLTKDGKLLSQAVLKDYSQFDLNSLKEQLERLLAETVSRLPYAGRVLSRDGNRVTINLGTKDGIQPNQLLNVIQIIQSQRHPKFNFLIKTEKEIIGKIKVLKVDETLSFGAVVTEKEKGAVQKNNKIGSLDSVSYGEAESLSPAATPEESLAQNGDQRHVFGKNAHAWKPQDPPSLGQAGVRLGLSRYIANTTLEGVGALEASNYFAPSIELDAELWITPEWIFFGSIKQGIVPVSNPRSGSQPTQLSQALSEYEAGFGYAIRLGPHVWSPLIEPFASYFNYRLFVDDSTPKALTTMQFSGLKLGLNASGPVSDDGRYGVGGRFSIALNPSLTETPVTSGSKSKNSVISFGILGYKKLGERLRAQVNLDLEMYSSSFSGTGTRAESASSTSQRFTTLSGGLYYMF